jgi:transglutaminase-like putative cysteine protease
MSTRFVYAIRHVTRFLYDDAVCESVMDVRLHPFDEASQTCHSFEMELDPPAHIAGYTDHMGNKIHHFNIPGYHRSLTLTTKSLVEVFPRCDIPLHLDASAWDSLDYDIQHRDFWEWLIPSHFTQPTEALHALAAELNVVRRDDPLALVREINTAIYKAFVYDQDITHVHSLIDDALRNRKGVCQDFTHIMLALLRLIGIPCRYVSGYLYHSKHDDHDRSDEGASHAWLEAYFPALGWVGFDPTNNRLACERHIKVAIGRDYRDVPPTRGLYRGTDKSKLEVVVHVARTRAPIQEVFVPEPPPTPKPIQRSVRQLMYQQQQQQQQ